MKNDIVVLKNVIAALKSGFDDLKFKLDLIFSNMSVKRVTLRKIKNKKAKIFIKPKRKKDQKDNNDSSDS